MLRQAQHERFLDSIGTMCKLHLPFALSLSKGKRGVSHATRTLFRASALLLIMLILNACGPDEHNARSVAEKFLDAHYVMINLPLAKTYATGLALKRVEDEIHLTEGQQIDASTRKPRVYYRLLEEKPRGEKSISFLYEATFSVDGAGQFVKKVLLTLRQEAEGWRVANYSEFD